MVAVLRTLANSVFIQQRRFGFEKVWEYLPEFLKSPDLVVGGGKLWLWVVRLNEMHRCPSMGLGVFAIHIGII